MGSDWDLKAVPELSLQGGKARQRGDAVLNLLAAARREFRARHSPGSAGAHPTGR